MIGGGIIVEYFFIISILLLIVYAWKKGINAYQCFIDGMKEGLGMFIHFYPSLCAMIFAITLLKESQILNVIVSVLSSFITFIPNDIWPMFFFRSLSGSASLALCADIFQQHGVDSFIGFLASIIQGSSETTFYVLTMYFSSISIQKTNKAMKMGFLADLINIIVAIVIAYLFYPK